MLKKFLCCSNVSFVLVFCLMLFYFTLNQNSEINFLSTVPVVIYSNSETDMKSIFIDNKGKSGVYR
jgi:hypothetical protein